MPSTMTDRVYGLTTSVAVKAPVKAVATSNVTLSGQQTIGGTALVAGDRVLVTAQTSSVNNGVYDVATGAWRRSADFDGNNDVVKGTIVIVPTTGGRGALYQVTSSDPIVIGSSAINFDMLDDPAITYPQIDDELVEPTNYMYAPGDVRRYGVLDDGTDQTTALQAVVADVGLREYVIPLGVKYNRTTLLADTDFPTNVVIHDRSQVNDFSSGGETAKHVGIVSRDAAENDTHWSIDSAHHPIFALNNHGSAGTGSATVRRATTIWNAGQFTLGGATGNGFRGVGMQQWEKSPDGNYWRWKIACLAPWVAVNGSYERWDTGQTISGSGVYRSNQDGVYVSTGAGTTGATAPTHSSGTVSDGGVSWTYVDSTDRTVWTIDEYGRIGNGASTDTFDHKVSITDPTGHYRMRLKARGASKDASLTLTPTDSGSSEVAIPYLVGSSADGLRILKSDSGAALAQFTDAGGAAVNEFRMLHSTAADADATPSVAGVGTLYVSNTGATNITALDDGSDNQIVNLVFTNANTTLVHSSSLTLTSSTNVTPTAYSVVTLIKVPTAISNRWVELCRSVK